MTPWDEDRNADERPPATPLNWAGSQPVPRVIRRLLAKGVIFMTGS
jgi:hypothetical protein